MKIKNTLENVGGGVECLYTGVSNPSLTMIGGVIYG